MKWVYDDGGRAAAGYSVKNDAGDCGVRAAAIATGIPYKETYEGIRAIIKKHATGDGSPRNGLKKTTMDKYMRSIGWEWVPLMKIGQGCTHHLRADELPGHPIVCRVSKHFVAVRGGVIYDNHDPSRGGTRCVYGYWQKKRGDRYE